MSGIDRPFPNDPAGVVATVDVVGPPQSASPAASVAKSAHERSNLAILPTTLSHAPSSSTELDAGLPFALSSPRFNSLPAARHTLGRPPSRSVAHETSPQTIPGPPIVRAKRRTSLTPTPRANANSLPLAPTHALSPGTATNAASHESMHEHSQAFLWQQTDISAPASGTTATVMSSVPAAHGPSAVVAPGNSMSVTRCRTSIATTANGPPQSSSVYSFGVAPPATPTLGTDQDGYASIAMKAHTRDPRMPPRRASAVHRPAGDIVVPFGPGTLVPPGLGPRGLSVATDGGCGGLHCGRGADCDSSECGYDGHDPRYKRPRSQAQGLLVLNPNDAEEHVIPTPKSGAPVSMFQPSISAASVGHPAASVSGGISVHSSSPARSLAAARGPTIQSAAPALSTSFAVRAGAGSPLPPLCGRPSGPAGRTTPGFTASFAETGPLAHSCGSSVQRPGSAAGLARMSPSRDRNHNYGGDARALHNGPQAPPLSSPSRPPMAQGSPASQGAAPRLSPVRLARDSSAAAVLDLSSATRGDIMAVDTAPFETSLLATAVAPAASPGGAEALRPDMGDGVLDATFASHVSAISSNITEPDSDALDVGLQQQRDHQHGLRGLREEHEQPPHVQQGALRQGVEHPARMQQPVQFPVQHPRVQVTVQQFFPPDTHVHQHHPHQQQGADLDQQSVDVDFAYDLIDERDNYPDSGSESTNADGNYQLVNNDIPLSAARVQPSYNEEGRIFDSRHGSLQRDVFQNTLVVPGAQRSNPIAPVRPPIQPARPSTAGPITMGVGSDNSIRFVRPTPEMMRPVSGSLSAHTSALQAAAIQAATTASSSTRLSPSLSPQAGCLMTPQMSPRASGATLSGVSLDEGLCNPTTPMHPRAAVPPISSGRAPAALQPVPSPERHFVGADGVRRCLPASGVDANGVFRYECKKAGGSYEYTRVLPRIVPNREAKVKGEWVAPSTVADLMRGYYDDYIDKFIIIDCRYAFEFDNGHLVSAVNLQKPESVWMLFLRLKERFGIPPPTDIDDDDSPAASVGAGALFATPMPFRQASIAAAPVGCVKRVAKKCPIAIIFHCEYSVNRGPRAWQLFRTIDRERSGPYLTFPETVVMSDGYNGFYHRYRHLTLGNYVSMFDSRFARGNSIASTVDSNSWDAARVASIVSGVWPGDRTSEDVRRPSSSRGGIISRGNSMISGQGRGSHRLQGPSLPMRNPQRSQSVVGWGSRVTPGAEGSSNEAETAGSSGAGGSQAAAEAAGSLSFAGSTASLRKPDVKRSMSVFGDSARPHFSHIHSNGPFSKEMGPTPMGMSISHSRPFGANNLLRAISEDGDQTAAAGVAATAACPTAAASSTPVSSTAALAVVPPRTHAVRFGSFQVAPPASLTLDCAPSPIAPFMPYPSSSRAGTPATMLAREVGKFSFGSPQAVDPSDASDGGFRYNPNVFADHGLAPPQQLVSSQQSLPPTQAISETDLPTHVSAATATTAPAQFCSFASFQGGLVQSNMHDSTEPRASDYPQTNRLSFPEHRPELASSRIDSDASQKSASEKPAISDVKSSFQIAPGITLVHATAPGGVPPPTTAELAKGAVLACDKEKRAAYNLFLTSGNKQIPVIPCSLRLPPLSVSSRFAAAANYISPGHVKDSVWAALGINGRTAACSKQSPHYMPCWGDRAHGSVDTCTGSDVGGAPPSATTASAAAAAAAVATAVDSDDDADALPPMPPSAPNIRHPSGLEADTAAAKTRILHAKALLLKARRKHMQFRVANGSVITECGILADYLLQAPTHFTPPELVSEDPCPMYDAKIDDVMQAVFERVGFHGDAGSMRECVLRAETDDKIRSSVMCTSAEWLLYILGHDTIFDDAAIARLRVLSDGTRHGAAQAFKNVATPAAVRHARLAMESPVTANTSITTDDVTLEAPVVNDDDNPSGTNEDVDGTISVMSDGHDDGEEREPKTLSAARTLDFGN